MRLLEREQLARDLHDTVAHHVSAIAIQAQAGTAVAPTGSGRRRRGPAGDRSARRPHARRDALDGAAAPHGRRRGRARADARHRRPAALAREDAGPPVDVRVDGDADTVPLAIAPPCSASRRRPSPTHAATRAMPPASTSACSIDAAGVRLDVTTTATPVASVKAGLRHHGHDRTCRAPRRHLRGGAARRRAAGPSPPRCPRAAAARVSVRVLIADDQELVRTGLRMILDAQPDIEVVGEASDGAEAVALARTLRPDVCLMDIRMPVVDGLEATRDSRRPRRRRSDPRRRHHHVRPRRVRVRGAPLRSPRIPPEERRCHAPSRGRPRRGPRRRPHRPERHACA